MWAALLVYMAVVDPVANGATVDEFDLLEVNRVFDEETGNERLAQIICWDWVDGHYRVQHWENMLDAYVQDDEEHRRQWEKERDEYLQSLPESRRMELRNTFTYRGKFVGGRAYPQRENGWYVSVFGDSSVMRIIKSRNFRYRMTYGDPEYADRDEYPVHQRRELTKLPEVQIE